MAEPPQWAQDLTIRVALDEGLDSLPALTWRRKRDTYSSGTIEFQESRVVVRAGKDRKDQKLVLLHELAHWLLPPDENHGPFFWDKAWELYRRYRVPIRYAKWREGQYRKGALVAYHRSVKQRRVD